MLLLVPLATSACRGGFDEIVVEDAAPAPAPAPPVLACNPPRFSITSASTLSSVATASGYDVFAVDDTGNVHGYVFDFDGDALLPGASAVPIAGNATGPLTPLAVGDDILLVMPYGRPDPTGTALITLDAELATKSMVMTDGVYGGGGALARSASGAIALVTQPLPRPVPAPVAPEDIPAIAVDAQLISPTGGVLAGPYAVVEETELAASQVILSARNGFLVSWLRRMGARQVRAKLLDHQLASTSSVLISPEAVHPIEPRAAYLASADRYLFVWYQKDEALGDVVWASLRNGDLSEAVPGPILISGTSKGLDPQVIAGDDDFLVVWRNDVGAHVGAARVTKDGQVAQPGIRTTGGQAVAWDIVVRHGQAALVWLESGGMGANLWLDPICE